MLGIIPESFRRLGISVEQVGDDIHIPTHDSYEIDTFIDGSIMTIADAPWPGLTPAFFCFHKGAPVWSLGHLSGGRFLLETIKPSVLCG